LIEAGVGTLHGKIDRVDPLVNAVTAVSTQNRLPFTPDWQANAGVSYQVHAANVLLTPRVDVFYQTRTYFDEGNTPQIAQLDPIVLLGASVAFEVPQKNWRVISRWPQPYRQEIFTGWQSVIHHVQRLRRSVVCPRS
jgi:iron complex outermembrane receptor protein